MSGPPEGILFFGGYDPDYPRNAIIRKGLESLGVRVLQCRADGMKKSVFRYPVLLARFLTTRKGRSAPIFVPDFRHKDVPLAWLLSRFPRRRLIFDPLVSRYETRVLDRGDAEEGSAQARHNWNIDRVTMRMADMVLADTESHAAFYVREFDAAAEKVKTLYLGYDDSVFGKLPERGRDGLFNVLFYGSFLPLHGTDVIVEAARLLDEGFRFRIVGTGQTMEEFRRKAEKIEGGRLELSGNVPERDLPGLIAEADAVLGVFGTTPKTAMVIPNKVYQAMACGRPVVTADTPAVREIFVPGEHLLCVPPGDAILLAGELKRLRDDGSFAATLAAKGGRLVREQYNPAKVAGRLLALLGAEDRA
jgi:glycosyltransferase involved in cell wall biosynthesis